MIGTPHPQAGEDTCLRLSTSTAFAISESSFGSRGFALVSETRKEMLLVELAKRYCSSDSMSSLDGEIPVARNLSAALTSAAP